MRPPEFLLRAAVALLVGAAAAMAVLHPADAHSVLAGLPVAP